MIRSVADLLHPHDPALLEAAMRDARRLHLKGDRAAEFARLLPWETFNTLPNAERLFDSELRIVQRGRDAMFDMAAPRANPGSERPLSAAALHGMCEQGMSLIVSGVERRVPAIAALDAMIERHFRVMTRTNCYVSFRQESALPAHFDDHDVLVLQVHGSKRWSFHGQPYRAPLVGDRFPAPEDPGPVEAEVLMEPGDLLFVPRGEVHWAQVEDATSLHLSVTVQPARGRDLLNWLGRVAEEEAIGRDDIRALEAADRLRAMVHGLADGLDLAAFHDYLDRSRDPFRPVNLGLVQALAADTIVQPALRRRVALVEGRQQLGDTIVTLTAAERDMLTLLLDRDSMTIAELDAMPEGRQTATGLARKALVFLFAGEPS